MKTCRTIVMLVIAAGLLGACEATYPTRQSSAQDNDIDGLSRDISHQEGGAVHDPMTPPPVHPAYVQDR